MFEPWWETLPASGERSPVVAGPSVALIDRLPWKWIGMIACSLLLIGGVVLLLPNRAPAQVIAVPLSDVQATPPPAAVQTVAVGGNAGRTNPVPGQPTATLSSARIPTVALGSDSIPTVTVTDTAPPTATLSSAPIPTATQSSRPTQAVQIKPTTAVGSTVEPVAPAITSVVAVTPEPPVEPTAIPDLRPMVPNLINMPQDEAVAKLDALDIGHDVIDVTSSNYQADIGSVAETDPAAGTRLNPGDVVILKVKKNKPQSDTPPAAPAEPAAPPPPPKP
jgi:hypothetical protein